MAVDKGPGGGRPIRYPSIVETLGKTYETDWTSTAHDQVKLIRDSVAQPNHFGDIPAARDFASVYSAALHVYEATLRGIKEDLEAAGAALARAGREMRERDEVSAAAFDGLLARWSTDDGFSSTREHDAAADDEPVTEGAEAKVRLEQESRDTAPGGPAPASDPAPPSSTGMGTDG